MQMVYIESDKPEIEYLDGVPVPKVSPKRTHSLVQQAVVLIFERCARGRGVYGPEWRYILGAVDQTKTEFVPDYAFISWQNLDKFDEQTAEMPPCAPDIAVEIRSPSSRVPYINKKIERYLKLGSQLVLDIDPQKQVVYAHTPGAVRTFAAGERFTIEAVPWLIFDVEELFRKPLRNAP